MRNAKSSASVQALQPRYSQLEAWKFADDLAVRVFHLSSSLPAEHRWLADQMRRAATSAPANIAEGYGRASNKEFLQFLAVAHGSIYEVDYYIHFMSRIGLIDVSVGNELRAECQRAARIVYGLMKSVRSDTRDASTVRRYLREKREVYTADAQE